MSLNVLLVDDDLSLCKIQAKILGLQGFTVVMSHSGNQALKAIRESQVPFDLIISDIRMPDGDGMYLLEKLLEIGFDNPRIMVSGYSHFSEKQILEKGGYCLLEKPIRQADLTTYIKEALASQKK